jgi:hypothetical protein
MRHPNYVAPKSCPPRKMREAKDKLWREEVCSYAPRFFILLNLNAKSMLCQLCSGGFARFAVAIGGFLIIDCGKIVDKLFPFWMPYVMDTG